MNLVKWIHDNPFDEQNLEIIKSDLMDQPNLIQDPNNYWEQLERLEKLIRASELKAGVIFSFHSFILGHFLDRLDYFYGIFSDNSFFFVISGLWMIFVVISIYYCFECFMPRFMSKFPKNVFFFRDAAYAFGSIEEYTKKVIDTCETHETLFEQLGNQIYIESVIIDKKFTSVQKSIKFFGFSLICIVSLVMFWLIKIY